MFFYCFHLFVFYKCFAVISMNTTITTTISPNFSTTTYPYINVTTAFCKTVIPYYTLSLTILSCLLSVFGSVVIIITYINIPRIQNFTRKLLLSLTVADLFTAVGNSMGSIRYLALRSEVDGCELVLQSDNTCVIQSFITTFSSMASFFWTSVIAFHIYMQIKNGSSRLRTGLMLIGYQVLCWGIPGNVFLEFNKETIET